MKSQSVEPETQLVEAMRPSAGSSGHGVAELSEEELTRAAELRLTERQVAMAYHYVQFGGKRVEAARRAGYTAGGWRANLVNPRWLEYVEHLTRQRLAASAPLALSSVIRLCGSARSESVQLSAALELLDRAGLSTVNKHLVGVAGGLELHVDLTPPSVENLSHPSSEGPRGVKNHTPPPATRPPHE